MESARAAIPPGKRRGAGAERVVVVLATAALLVWLLRSRANEPVSAAELDVLREVCRRVTLGGGEVLTPASRAVALYAWCAAALGRFEDLDPTRPEGLLRLPAAIATTMLAPLAWCMARGRLGVGAAVAVTLAVVATSVGLGWARIASPAPLCAVIVGAVTLGGLLAAKRSGLEAPPEPPGDALRVACVGDSITAGSGYPAVLERLLEGQLGRPVVVRNAGRSGHNTRMFLDLPASALLGGMTP